MLQSQRQSHSLCSEETFDGRFIRASKFNLASILMRKQQSFLTSIALCNVESNAVEFGCHGQFQFGLKTGSSK